MTEKARIKQFLEYKGISKNKFYVQTGLSVGFLDNGNSLVVDKLKKVFNTYPELNIEWVVTGEGSMIKTKQSTASSATLLEIIKEKDARIEQFIRENERLALELKNLKKNIQSSASSSKAVASAKDA